MINFANNLILDFEKDSDRRISVICRALTVLTIVVILLNILHVFKISSALYPTLIVSAVILLMPTLFYDIWGYEWQGALHAHRRRILFFLQSASRKVRSLPWPGIRLLHYGFPPGLQE